MRNEGEGKYYGKGNGTECEIRDKKSVYGVCVECERNGALGGRGGRE